MTEPFPSGITAPQEWLDSILPRCPNVTPDFVKHEILTVLRDFFQFGGSWRDWLGPITLHHQQVHYSVELADYKAELVSVFEGYRLSDNLPIYPVIAGQRNADIELMTEGTPQYMYCTPEGLLVVFPYIPVNTGEQIKIFATMKPIDLCVPTWIKLKWHDAIVNGVLGRLYLSPGPNYKPDLGARMEKRYVAQRARSTVDAINSGMLGVEVARPPSHFARGSQRDRRVDRGTISGLRWP